jgi:hypothetical protein
MAISILRPMAESGLAEAQFQLGRLVLTECDLVTGREGFEWLYAAARQGHSEAQYKVATYPSFPNEPFESPLSSTTRWEFLLSAAAAGITDAQCHAGACLATGKFGDDFGVPIDLSSAVDWYRRASEAGHATAQFNLACMLINGEGCTPNRVEGIRWLESAAQRGDEQAREFLVYLAGESAE